MKGVVCEVVCCVGEFVYSFVLRVLCNGCCVADVVSWVLCAFMAVLRVRSGAEGEDSEGLSVCVCMS